MVIVVSGATQGPRRARRYEDITAFITRIDRFLLELNHYQQSLTWRITIWQRQATLIELRCRHLERVTHLIIATLNRTSRPRSAPSLFSQTSPPVVRLRGRGRYGLLGGKTATARPAVHTTRHCVRARTASTIA